jgi:hypothetical protein
MPAAVVHRSEPADGLHTIKASVPAQESGYRALAVTSTGCRQATSGSVEALGVCRTFDVRA